MTISKLNYLNKTTNTGDFEITTIERFFSSRPKKHLEKDYRLNFFVLLYIVHGEGTHVIDFVEHTYNSGSLIVISKNTISSFRVNKETKGYLIFVSEDFFIENSDMHDISIINFFDSPLKNPVIPIDTSLNTSSRQIIELLYKEAYLDVDDNQRLLKTLFTAFVYSIRKETNSTIKNKEINSYKNYYLYKNLLEDNYRKLKHVSDYSSLMNLSRKTINYSCRESVGLSAKELITSRIILEVKRLLVQGEMKNFEISYFLGFDEPANLATLFKKNVGISMSKYKELKKQQE